MKKIKAVKRWLQRLLMLIGLSILILTTITALSIRWKELDGNSIYGTECVSQNFDKTSEDSLKLAIAQRFAPNLILDESEPADPKDIGILFSVEKWGDGYKITYQILYPKDWGSKNLIWKHRVWYLVRFAANIMGTIGGHNGDAETVVAYIDNIGFNDIGQIVFSLVRVDLKLHQNWRIYYPSAGRIKCKLGVSSIVFASQGTHAMYASIRECNSSLGNKENQFSTDKCSHGEEINFDILPEFDVGTPEKPNNALANSEVLQNLFPNESLLYETFCGGKRKGDENCEAKLNFDQIKRALIVQNGEVP